MNKAVKLSNAMNDVLSGGRCFSKPLAAQCRDELKRLDAENKKMRSALEEFYRWWMDDEMSSRTAAPACVFMAQSILQD